MGTKTFELLSHNNQVKWGILHLMSGKIISNWMKKNTGYAIRYEPEIIVWLCSEGFVQF